MSDVLVSCPTVVVGAFTADGVTPDTDGIVWTVSRLDGWWDSTSVRAVRQEKLPFGEVVSFVRENGRALVLELVAHAAGGQSALGSLLCFTAVESIAVPFACVYQSVVLEVIDPVLDLHASVRRVAPIKSTMLGNAVAMKFQILLLAPDPYRYDSGDNPFD